MFFFQSLLLVENTLQCSQLNLPIRDVGFGVKHRNISFGQIRFYKWVQQIWCLISNQCSSKFNCDLHWLIIVTRYTKSLDDMLDSQKSVWNSLGGKTIAIALQLNMFEKWKSFLNYVGLLQYNNHENGLIIDIIASVYKSYVF